LTICTHDRRLTLRDPALKELVTHTWQGLPSRFPTVRLDEFVVMPNHVHALIFLSGTDRGTPRPRLSDVIGAFKSLSAIACNRHRGRTGAFWQRNYYERVIRDDRELNAARQYIRDNPRKWDEDINNPQRITMNRPKTSAAP
jgi:REP element-mobilizing transposase RayT